MSPTNFLTAAIERVGDQIAKAIRDVFGQAGALLFCTLKQSTFTTAATSATQITGMTGTIDVKANGRPIEIKAFFYATDNSNGSASNFITIWDGTVGSGTLLATGLYRCVAANSGGSITVEVPPSVVLSPGSHTINVGLHTNLGTAGVYGGTGSASFLSAKQG